MATGTPSKANLSVQHNFDGDPGILNATFEAHTEVRKALTTLAKELQRSQRCSTRIKAEIKLQVSDNTPNEHVYTVTISDLGFNALEFAQAVQERTTENHGDTGTVSSLWTAGTLNGQQATPGLSTPKPESHRTDIDDEVVDIRPFKRQRTSASTEKASTPGSQQQAPPLTPMPQMQQPPMPAGIDNSMTYLRNWHEEWTSQGGWLFDNLMKTSTTLYETRTTLEKRLDAVQDILGQSINASSAGTIAELGSIAKLAHWLEHCRKTSADKLQAREEKWRSSSATFHDSARREREAAEKRIERKLDEQNELLIKLARSNNIGNVKLGNVSGGSDERSREASLGAQLTAELNMEAGRHRAAEDEPFNVDD